jgi:hypothetical protein
MEITYGGNIPFITIDFRNISNEMLQKFRREINIILDATPLNIEYHNQNMDGAIIDEDPYTMKVETVENALWNVVKLLNDNDIKWTPHTISINGGRNRTDYGDIETKVGFMKITKTYIKTFLIDQNGRLEESHFELPVPKDKI